MNVFGGVRAVLFPCLIFQKEVFVNLTISCAEKDFAAICVGFIKSLFNKTKLT